MQLVVWWRVAGFSLSRAGAGAGAERNFAGGVLMLPVGALWRHETRKLSFTLVVDDFGVKYQDEKSRMSNIYLKTALKQLYDVTTDWEGKLYVGVT